ncbi:membrane-associated kinase regulator 5-like [Nicotiana tabacum]|uniref:Membrane-associated kinase regulator 5-like n=1 Tax=Nicotiana tabacum TaxID=4097 RepID=A0A1S3Z241_TOBAC|nr:PREDICTED: probable membrane-associated kinase regulator 2 [Nicotiana tabacum]
MSILVPHCSLVFLLHSNPLCSYYLTCFSKSMEAFNILKFWRTAAVRDIVSDFDSVNNFVDVHRPLENDEKTNDDEDSFFDLVFTGHPKEYNNAKSVSETNLPESPKDVFFKPKAFPIDSNSKPLSPNSILRSAPKFRVCFLGFRKSKPEKVGVDDSYAASPKMQDQKLSPKAQSYRFTTKCKVEEVPASCISFRYNKSLKGNQVRKEEEVSSVKDSSKQDMPKYLKLMKPLYSRASKRYTDNIKISDNVSRASQLCSPSMQSLSLPRKSSEEGKQGSRVAVLGVVRKQLRKSRSMASVPGVSTSPMNRRDDSLLEQNDGIQSAILHCKRCYSSASKDCSVLLSRSANEDLPRASSEELNRWSI